MSEPNLIVGSQDVFAVDLFESAIEQVSRTLSEEPADLLDPDTRVYFDYRILGPDREEIARFRREMTPNEVIPGRAEYQWEQDDLTAGTLLGQITVRRSDRFHRSEKFYVRVVEPLVNDWEEQAILEISLLADHGEAHDSMEVPHESVDAAIASVLLETGESFAATEPGILADAGVSILGTDGFDPAGNLSVETVATDTQASVESLTVELGIHVAFAEEIMVGIDIGPATVVTDHHIARNLGTLATLGVSTFAADMPVIPIAPLIDEDWDDGNHVGWTWQTIWDTQQTSFIECGTGNAKSGTCALKQTFPNDVVTAGAPSRTFSVIHAGEEIYARVWFKWQFFASEVRQRIFRLAALTGSTIAWGPAIGVQSNPASGNTGNDRTNLYVDITGLGNNRRFANRGTAGTHDMVFTGQYHEAELFVKPSSAGLADGEVRVWLDGTLIHEWTGVNTNETSAAPSAELSAIYFDSTIEDPPGGSIVFRRLWLDDITVSRQRIGFDGGFQGAILIETWEDGEAGWDWQGESMRFCTTGGPGGGGYLSTCAAWSGYLIDGAAIPGVIHIGRSGTRHFSPHGTFYLRWYQYVSSPYTFGTQEDTLIQLSPAGGGPAIATVALSRLSQGKPAVHILETDTWLAQNQGSDITIAAGKWYLFELHVDMNTPSFPDGKVRLWVNDATTPPTSQTLRLSSDAVSWNSAGPQIDRLSLTPLFWSAADPPAGAYLKYDEIAIATGPVGP